MVWCFGFVQLPKDGEERSFQKCQQKGSSQQWRGRDGMGFGDVKLMAMIGVWLGPVSLLPIFFVASMAGVIFGCAMTLAGAKHHGLGLVKVPFGCFLATVSIAWLILLRF